MADEKAKVILDLDNAEFVKKLRESLDLLGGLGRVDSVAGLASTFKSIGAVAGVAAVAVLAVKSALDFQLEAENLKQIDASFDALSQTAGVAGDALKSRLEASTKGLADFDDVLQAANKSMINLGKNSEKLPEIMDLSRKVTKIFGGDLVETFGSISTAIAAGNTRMLRQYGIVIDADAAVKKYAKSIGHTSDELNQHGRQTAILNEVLEKGNATMSGVEKTTKPLGTAIKLLKVQVGELSDDFVLFWDRLFGPSTTKVGTAFFGWLTDVAKGMRSLLGAETLSVDEKIQGLQKTLGGLQKDLEYMSVKRFGNTFTKEETDKVRSRISSVKLEIQLLQEEQRKLNSLESQKKQTETKDVSDQLNTDVAEKNALKNREIQIRNKKTILDLEIQNNTEVQDAERLHYQQRMLIYEEWNLKRAQLAEEYEGRETLLKQRLEETDRQFYERTIQHAANANEKVNQMKLDAMERQVKASQTFGEGIANSFKLGSMRAQQDLTNWGKTGGIVFDSVKKRSVEAFRAMGDGSKSAGEAMRGFIFGAIADTAEAKGSEMLLAGLWPPNPLAIAGGGALIALASALRAQAQGNSKFSGGGGAGAGGGGVAETPTTDQKPEAKEVQKKSVTVNISGSYYETEQTRERLMTMIREAGDFTDFNLKQIGQP